jgi:ubiquitin-conjugating enzyme E2 U
MASRPALILAREKARIIQEKLWGVEFIEISSVLEWNLYLSGPIGTPWERARFKLILYFTETYPETPPHLFFQTVPFHPNIDLDTGRPCIAFLEPSFWRKDIEVGQILIHLQVSLL